MPFTLNKTLNYIFALIWLTNGLCCKILNFAPRHQQIVAQILGDEYSYVLIKFIGISEVMMAIWIVSRKYSKFNAVFQICIIMTMNILEFTLAPQLLLWGKMNIVFASSLCICIYLNEFHLKPKHNV